MLIYIQDGSLRTFSGHLGSVYSAAVAPDGRTLLSGGQDTTLKGVAEWLNAKDQSRPIRTGGNSRERYLTLLTIPARLKRTGIEMRMVVDDGSEPGSRSRPGPYFFSGAHAIHVRLLEEPSLPLKEIAAEEGISSSYVTRLLRLAFLAPDIVTAILNGRHPPQLTANRLMDDTTSTPRLGHAARTSSALEAHH